MRGAKHWRYNATAVVAASFWPAGVFTKGGFKHLKYPGKPETRVQEHNWVHPAAASGLRNDSAVSFQSAGERPSGDRRNKAGDGVKSFVICKLEHAPDARAIQKNASNQPVALLVMRSAHKPVTVSQHSR